MFLIIIAAVGAVIIKDIIVDQLPDYILNKLRKICQFMSV